MKKDLSTEEKIKEAARKIFQQKGYAGARTRDIAEEAGINLALLNYYYRSKEKLFELVMHESLFELFSAIKFMFNEPSSNLSEKIDSTVNTYFDILLKNPNLPLFILGEIQANPDQLKEKIGLSDTFVFDTVLYKQLQDQLKAAGMMHLNPAHLVINMLSMTIFPFVAKPLLIKLTHLDEEAFKQFVEERRKLVPYWLKLMLQLPV